MKKEKNQQEMPEQADRDDIADAVRAAGAYAAESVNRLSSGTRAHRDCADIYPDFKAAVEYLSGGSNTVLLDDEGMPSVMVRIDRMILADLLDRASDAFHPAFMMSGVSLNCIYYSKYQNIVRNGRAYSLPIQDPQTHVTFGDACGYCSKKGPGWSLTPFSLRAAVALWARNNGTLPRGNNDSGHDYLHAEEKGMPTSDGRVATGSGPRSWNHNGRADGICDLNGNMNEWDAGLRTMAGEIQIMPGSDCMLPNADLSPESSQWRAILPDGTLVEPGTQGTLHYHGWKGGIQLSTSARSIEKGLFNCAFQDITAEEGLMVPEIIKALMLFPESRDTGVSGGWRWINDVGECLPLCGGAHKALDHAGVFFVGLTYPRCHQYELSGFRSAYVPPI